MSTIASLLSLIDPSAIKPWSEGMESVRREEFGRQRNETGLIDLAELKAKQAAQAAVYEKIKNDPEVARQLLGGGPVLGSLMQPQPTPGAGPITQSPLGGGPSQQIPAYPDASRFAGVSPQGGGPIPPGMAQQMQPQVTPPQSTIGSLGPAGHPQPQMQAPQNPLLEMARTDPRAAMMLQQQMQGAQEQRWKTEERRLDMGVKIAEAVAQELNGVRDQPSLDAARARVQQYHPQAAAQIPQFYSKEALEPLIMKGVAVKDLALWRKNMAQARQADMMTEQLPGTFRALEQFATGGGGQAPTGEAVSTTTAPTTAQPAGRAGQPPQESEHTRLIRAEAIRQDVDPALAVAVATQESYLNPNAEGDGGKAKGYFQLHEGAAKDAKIDPARRHEPALNIQGGVSYLKQKLAQTKGNVDEALKLYNGGGDPNYVANVRRFLPGTTGTTGTAQAPPTSPKIAQLDARIKEGQALALRLSATQGMEQAAAMVNQQVNDLQKDRDRLDAPRQEFLKKQAVHDLELQQQRQQGADAAQLKADTEPASKEEIDAVNRGLPPDKRVPYGTTRKQLREQGRVGGELLSPKVTEDLTNTTTAIQQFEELNNAVAQLPTGPLTQYVEGFKERWGIDISDAKVAQRAILAGATNQLLQARSGAAINESEYQRLLKELPNESNDPKVFKARLANTVRQFKNLYKTKVQILRKTGHAIPDDLMEPLAAPEGAPVPKPSSVVDKFKTIKP